MWFSSILQLLYFVFIRSLIYFTFFKFHKPIFYKTKILPSYCHKIKIDCIKLMYNTIFSFFKC